VLYQVHIENVNIRYEDEDVSIAVRCQNLGTYSCNASWQEFFSHDAATRHKIIAVKQFKVTYDAANRSDLALGEILKALNSESELSQFVAAMNEAHGIGTPILSPVDAVLKTTRRIGDGGAQLFDIQFEVDRIALTLHSSQYHSFLAVNSQLHAFQLKAPHVRERPATMPKEAPAQWWRYAISCVRRKRQKRWPTLETVMVRRCKQKRYIELFQKVQDVPWLGKHEKLTPEDTAEFDAITNDASLSVDDVMLFRAMAMQTVKAKAVSYAKEEASQSGGWFGFMSGKKVSKTAKQMIQNNLSEEEEASLRSMVSEYWDSDQGNMEIGGGLGMTIATTAKINLLCFSLEMGEERSKILLGNLYGTSGACTYAGNRVTTGVMGLQRVDLEDLSVPGKQIFVIQCGELAKDAGQACVFTVTPAAAPMAMTELDVGIQKPIMMTHSRQLAAAIKDFFAGGEASRHVQLAQAQIGRQMDRMFQEGTSQLHAMSVTRTNVHLTARSCQVVCKVPTDAHDEASSFAVLSLRECRVDTELTDPLAEAYNITLNQICVSLAENPEQWAADCEDPESKIHILRHVDFGARFEKRFVQDNYGKLYLQQQKLAFSSTVFHMELSAEGCKELVALFEGLAGDPERQDDLYLSCSPTSPWAVEGMPEGGIDEFTGNILASSAQAHPVNVMGAIPFCIEFNVPSILVSLGLSAAEPIANLLLEEPSITVTIEGETTQSLVSFTRVRVRDLMSASRDEVNMLDCSGEAMARSTIRYSQAPTSPDSVSVQLQPVRMQWNFKTITAMNGHLTDYSPARSAPGGNTEAAEASTASPAISVSCPLVTVTLNREDIGRHLAQIELNDLDLDIVAKSNDAGVPIRLYTASVKGFSAQSFDHGNRLTDVASAQATGGDPAVRLDFEQILAGTGNDFLRASVKPLDVTYVQRDAMEIIDYILADGVCGAVTTPDKTAPPYKLTLDVSVSLLSVQIPSCDATNDYVAVACKDVFITNSFVSKEWAGGAGDVDRTQIRLPEVVLSAHIKGQPAAEVVTAPHLDVVCLRRLGQAATWQGVGSKVAKLACHVAADLPLNVVTLSAAHASLILRAWYQNVSLDWTTMQPPPDLSLEDPEVSLLQCSVKLQQPTVELQLRAEHQARKVRIQTEEFGFTYTNKPSDNLITVSVSSLDFFESLADGAFPEQGVDSLLEGACFAKYKSSSEPELQMKGWNRAPSGETRDSALEFQLGGVELRWRHDTIASLTAFCVDAFAGLNAPESEAQAEKNPRKFSLGIESAVLLLSREDVGKEAARLTIGDLHLEGMTHTNQLTEPPELCLRTGVSLSQFELCMSQDLDDASVCYALLGTGSVSCQVEFKDSTLSHLRDCRVAGVTFGLHNGGDNQMLFTVAYDSPVSCFGTAEMDEAKQSFQLECSEVIRVHVDTDRGDSFLSDKKLGQVTDIIDSVLMVWDTASESGALPTEAVKAVAVYDLKIPGVEILFENHRDGVCMPLLKFGLAEIALALQGTPNTAVGQLSFSASVEHFSQMRDSTHCWQPAVETFSPFISWETALDIGEGGEGEQQSVNRLNVTVDSFVVVDVTPELLRTLNNLPPLQARPKDEVVITNTLPYRIEYQVLPLLEAGPDRVAPALESIEACEEGQVPTHGQKHLCRLSEASSRHLRIKILDWGWSGTMPMQAAKSEHATVLACADGQGRECWLCVEACATKGGLELIVFARYCIMNGTGIPFHMVLRQNDQPLMQPSSSSLCLKNSLTRCSITIRDPASPSGGSVVIDPQTKVKCLLSGSSFVLGTHIEGKDGPSLTLKLPCQSQQVIQGTLQVTQTAWLGYEIGFHDNEWLVVVYGAEGPTQAKSVFSSNAAASVLEMESFPLGLGLTENIKGVREILHARILMENGVVEPGFPLIQTPHGERHEADVTALLRESLLQGSCLVLTDAGVQALVVKASLPPPKQGYRYKPGDMCKGEYKFGGITRGLFGAVKDAVKGEATGPPRYLLEVQYKPAGAMSSAPDRPRASASQYESRLIEKTAEDSVLGRAVASLKKTPKEYVDADRAAIAGHDKYDNATLSYGPDASGNIWEIRHSRKLNWNMHHTCQVTVTARLARGDPRAEVADASALKAAEFKKSRAAINTVVDASAQPYQLSAPILLSECNFEGMHHLELSYGSASVSLSLLPTDRQPVRLSHADGELSQVPELSFSVKASASHGKSLIVMIMPRFVLTNSLSRPINVMQKSVTSMAHGVQEERCPQMRIEAASQETLGFEGQNSNHQPPTLLKVQPASHQIKIGLGGGWTEHIAMQEGYDEVHQLKLADGTSQHARVCVTSGLTTVVTVCEEKNAGEAEARAEASAEESELKHKSELSVSLDVKGFAVSAVNTELQQEILNISLGDVACLLNHSVSTNVVEKKAPLLPMAYIASAFGASETKFDITIGRLQVDNLLTGTLYQVMLSEEAARLNIPFLVVQGVSRWAPRQRGSTPNYPRIQLAVQSQKLHLACDTQLIMRLLSKASPWRAVLFPSIDPRGDFIQLVPAADLTWCPSPFCRVEKLQISGLALLVSIRSNPAAPLSEETVSMIVGHSLPGLVKNIVTGIIKSSSFSMDRFPLNAEAYAISNKLMAPECLAGEIGSGVGEQLGSVSLFSSVGEGLNTVSNYVHSRLGYADGASVAAVRGARPIYPDVPLMALDAVAPEAVQAYNRFTEARFTGQGAARKFSLLTGPNAKADSRKWGVPSLVEKTAEDSVLDRAVASLKKTPKEYVDADRAAIAGHGKYDNATLSYGPDVDGNIWEIRHSRKLHAGFHHTCQVTVTVCRAEAESDSEFVVL